MKKKKKPIAKVGLNDLKLLADAAYSAETGETEHVHGRGLGAACNRLVRAGLIERQPNGYPDVVRITVEGQEAIGALLSILGVYFRWPARRKAKR